VNLRNYSVFHNYHSLQKQQIKVVPGQKLPVPDQGRDMQLGQGEPPQLSQRHAEELVRMEDAPQPCPLMSDEELDEDIMDESLPKEMDEIGKVLVHNMMVLYGLLVSQGNPASAVRKA
jgi:hypothetical protein